MMSRRRRLPRWVEVAKREKETLFVPGQWHTVHLNSESFGGHGEGGVSHNVQHWPWLGGSFYNRPFPLPVEASTSRSFVLAPFVCAGVVLVIMALFIWAR